MHNFLLAQFFKFLITTKIPIPKAFLYRLQNNIFKNRKMLTCSNYFTNKQYILKQIGGLSPLN